MPGEIQTSFIPKAPITAHARPAQASSVGFMTVIGLVLALSSGAIFAGAFAYQSVLKQEVASAKAMINDIRENKMPAENLKQMEELNTALTNARNLLSAHVSTNRIFTLLQDTTVPAVSYNSFSFSGNEVKVKGVAKSYEDVASQANVFESDKFKGKFSSVQFSDFTVDKVTKAVTFSLALTVVPSEFRYTGEMVGSTTLPIRTTATGTRATGTPPTTTP